MMKIVLLAGEVERHMVSRMSIERGHNRQTDPEPREYEVRTEKKRAKNNREHIAHDMFEPMGVDRCDSDRGRPFVMFLVNVFVNSRMMKHAM